MDIHSISLTAMILLRNGTLKIPFGKVTEYEMINLISIFLPNKQSFNDQIILFIDQIKNN